MSQLIKLVNSSGLTASNTWDPFPPYEFGRGRSRYPGVPEADPNLGGGGNVAPGDEVALAATLPVLTKAAVTSYRWYYLPNFSGVDITATGASATVTFDSNIVKNTVYTIYCEALDANGEVQWYCEWKFFVSNPSWLFELLDPGLMEYERWESYELYESLELETGVGSALMPFKFVVSNVDANSNIIGGYIDASYEPATPVEGALYSIGKPQFPETSTPPALITQL